MWRLIRRTFGNARSVCCLDLFSSDSENPDPRRDDSCQHWDQVP
jgi:hypothetical protein